MSNNAFDKIDMDKLDEVIGGVDLNKLDAPHRNMLNFLMSKLDRQSFEDLLKAIKETDDIDKARRLIELPYSVHVGH